MSSGGWRGSRAMLSALHVVAVLMSAGRLGLEKPARTISKSLLLLVKRGEVEHVTRDEEGSVIHCVF